MCGRYTVTKNKNQIEEVVGSTINEEYIENYNAAPTDRLPVITNKNSNVINLFQWGLIPFWSKDSGILGKLINARLETIFEKPSFKQIIKKKRCAIIADGYYEWMTSGTSKQPYYIYLEGHKPFMFGGIWDSWDSDEGIKINTFSIITKAAKGAISEIHHRVPVILNKELTNNWLTDLNKEQINIIANNNLNEQLVFHAVSKSVNSTRNNYKELIYSI